MPATILATTRYVDYHQRLAKVLSAFEEFLKAQVEGFEPELKEVVTAVLRHPGKRLRPGLLFATAGIFERPSEQALRLAAVVELIHLSTLIHDDILDDARTRHGETAHHLLFNPKISVLAGDTLFLRANELSAREDDVWVGRAVSAAAKATCSGEIMQGLREGKGPLGLHAYERQLLLKTGKLFGLSCSLGAFLAGLPQETREALARYGESFGVAYQLYDDAADLWGSEAVFKKTLGIDQQQRKWTLPWILLEGKIGEVALEPLWGNRPAALSAMEKEKIFAEGKNVFEATLSRADKCLAGLPQAKLLRLPIEGLREKFESLCEPKKELKVAGK